MASMGLEDDQAKTKKV